MLAGMMERAGTTKGKMRASRALADQTIASDAAGRIKRPAPGPRSIPAKTIRRAVKVLFQERKARVDA
jgi:hypothetical protein